MARPKIPIIRFEDVLFETIQGCNRKCWHCPNKDIETTGALMEWSLIERIIDELVAMDFCGHVRPYLMNECFMDPRMPDVMRRIREKLPKALCVVNTNGDKLSLELAHEMSRIGVKIRVSAYSPEVLHRFEAARIPRMHITNYTRLRERLPETFNNRAGALPELGSEIPHEGCHYPSGQMYIRHDGKAVLCCNDYYSQVVMGDVTRDALMTIFNNPRYRKYRRALAKGERLPPLCDKCNVLERTTWRTPPTS